MSRDQHQQRLPKDEAEAWRRKQASAPILLPRQSSALAFRPSFGPRVSAFGLPRGFTLIEVLLALAICAIVLVAINAVFSTAIRLRNKTSAAVEDQIPVDRALEALRRDLKGSVGPGGFLAGDFKCGAQAMGTSMGLTGEAGNGGLDFFTSTGVIGDNAAWGDLQEVFYELKAPTDRNQTGMDLVRCINRNLLAATTPTPETQSLLSHIETVQFECFDGSQWRPTWDTSAGDTNLPFAVRITIQMAAKPGEDVSRLQPYQVLVPLVSQTLRTNQTSSVGGGG